MQAVVIAAGESKRFWPLNNGIHKSQFKLLGKPLMYWTLRGLKESGVKDVVIVVGKSSSIPEMLAQENDLGITTSYVVQEKPLGTGNALWQAKDLIQEPFFLLWANKIYSEMIIAKMKEKAERDKVSAVLAGATTEKPSSEFGMIEIGKETVTIKEKPEHTSSNIRVVGAYYFQPDFFTCYGKLPKHHETDLVDAINVYTKERKADYVIAQEDIPSLKYPWDLFPLMDLLFASREPSIAPTATIGKNVVIDGPVYIGDKCVIGHHNVLRGPLNLEAGVRTGAFMEIKHSIVQEETTFHSGYVGDSVIGKNCRFGAGFITGNVRLDKKPIYGFSKLGCIVGDNSMFGIHSGTMPGVLVGANCKVGPGTQVFENLPGHTTFYARFDYTKKQ